MIEMTETNDGILQRIRDAYNEHKAARMLTKAFESVALGDPAQAALEAFTGTQTTECESVYDGSRNSELEEQKINLENDKYDLEAGRKSGAAYME